MMVAMASDIRVILIKLADRLHNMRTIGAMPKQKQIEKAKETLEIYAPIAHRLGIHAIKWELEDLAFAALHPRKYKEIKGLVNQQREEREHYVEKAGEYLLARARRARASRREISGRAKHFYSIYSKMTKKGREFNEIYDLTAMRVIVDSVKDCYGAVGVIHSLWKPLPGRFKDFVAMPKFNMYQSLHTTVIGPEGRPLEIQIRTREMHDMAEFGVAAHWIYKDGADGRRPAAGGDAKLKWLRAMLDWQQDLARPAGVHGDPEGRPVRGRGLRLHAQGRGQVAGRRARRRWTSPTRSTPTSATAASARRSTARSCRCTTSCAPGDIVEVLTSKRERGPSRDWLALVKTTRARNKIKQWFKAESRDDTEHAGRELLQEHLKKRGPAARRRSSARRCSPTSSARWASARPTTSTSPSAARRSRRRSSSTRSCSASSRARRPKSETDRRDPGARPRSASASRPTSSSTEFGIEVEGVEDVMLRLAKCCRPGARRPDRRLHLARARDHHPPRGLPQRRRAAQGPRALHRGQLGGRRTRRPSGSSSQVDAWDRHRLLEDLSRTFAEAGINIVEARCIVSHPMVQNRFVVEVGDTQVLKGTINRLRNIDAVFDAYRVTPGSG